MTEVADGRKTLIWTIFDEEAEIIAAELRANGIEPLVLSGATKERDRADILRRFALPSEGGGSDILIGKASMLGFGLNLQFVRAMIFSGFSDSFEQFYQAVRRAYRYGQLERLRVYLPYVQELEGVVWQNLLRKQGNFEEDANQCERYYKEALEGLI
jgi:superfamily II DNA or RNA helicase